MLRSIGVVIDPFRAYYNISVTEFSALPAVACVGLAIGGLFGGPIAERLGTSLKSQF